MSKELAKVERDIAHCIVFITEGDGDPGSIAETLRDLEARKKALTRELDTSPMHPKAEMHPNVGELYRRNVGKLQTLLEDEATKTEAVDAIRSLIERIEIHAGGKRGHPHDTIVGALAKIMAFSSQDDDMSKDGRVLLVAGLDTNFVERSSSRPASNCNRCRM